MTARAIMGAISIIKSREGELRYLQREDCSGSREKRRALEDIWEKELP